MSDVERADPRPKERKRRKQANKLNKDADKYYQDYWDIKHIARIEEEAGEFSHKDENKSALQILEYADGDVLIDTHANQHLIQEKFVQHYTNGDCLLIRSDNGSKNIPSEAEKYKNSYEDTLMLKPGIIGYGRAQSETKFKWFWIIDAMKFISAWDRGISKPSEGVYTNSDGTKSLMFPPDEVEKSNSILRKYGDIPDRLDVEKRKK